MLADPRASEPNPLEDLAEAIGRHALGFDEVRPEQRLAAAAALEGRDVLAVLPTGSGKSAIYQIAGPARPGCSVVVSPLLALQADQVRSIGGRLGGARVLSSELTDGERDEVLRAITGDDLEFVFCAPEQLANDEVRAALAAARPSLFVVDEAHLIVSWGRDFRPDYLRLGAIADELGRPPILALTATAAPPVRDAIVGVLGLHDPLVVVGELVRHNIDLEVVTVPDPVDVEAAVIGRAAELAGTGIVYVAKRSDAERLAERLSTPRRPALAFHAGLSRRRKAEVQGRFSSSEPCIVVATIAFGLGIDVAHVRFVLHADVPEDLDAYYQEVGRAGRDGEQAVGCVVRAATGSSARSFMGGTATVDDETLEIVAAIPHTAGPMPLDEVVAVARRPKGRVLSALELLERAGAVAVDGSIGPGDRPLEDALADARELRDVRDVVQRTRASMTDRYLSGDACRWAVLAGYLGDPSASACGTCDVCRAGGGTPPSARLAEGPFAPGAPVVHATFGAGVVVERDEDSISVLFDQAGYRRIALELVEGSAILVPAEPAALAALTRSELLALAERRGVRGRSKMRKEELAAAVGAALGGGSPAWTGSAGPR